MFEQLNNDTQGVEKTKKEEIAKIRESAVGFFEILDKEYYNFLNNLEDLEKEIREDDEKRIFLEEMFRFLGVSKEEMKEIIDIGITGAIEKMYETAQKENMNISQDNSALDIFRNSILTGINYANKIVNIIREGKIKKFEDITDTKKQGLEFLKKSMVNIPNYIDLICEDEEKIKSELNSLDGWLGKFKKYFKTTKNGDVMFPGGGKKIAYMKLFDELTPENTRDLIENNHSIDKNILDTEKIIADISRDEKIER